MASQPPATPAASTPIPVAAPGPGTGGGGDTGQPDPALPDQSGSILDAFGLEGNWSEAMTGLEAELADPARGGSQASAPAPASAAEGAPASPAPAPATPAQQLPAGASQPQPEPQPGTTPGSASAATAPAAAPGGDPEVQALKAQVQALQHLLQTAQQPQSAQPAGGQQPQQPTGSQPAQDEPTPDQLMTYQVGIPADVLNAINSEDPREQAAGLAHLANNFARLTHQRVMQHVDQVLRSTLAQQATTQRVTSEQQEMMRDYYGAFPAHDDPLNRVVVAMEAQAMWNETPGLAWNEQTRNALGARVDAKLGRSTQPQNGHGTQPQPQAQPAPQPAAMTGANTRPQASSEQAGSDFITNVLSAL